jgi:DNA-binding GntR family transcriptional regulator
MTKTELVYNVLRGRILDLAYRPGDYFNVDDFARRNQVSPIPVREAVVRLVEERLMVMRPHVGAGIAPLDETSVRETFALLEGLEMAATHDIVARATSDDLAELGEILDGIDVLRMPSELAKWDEANASFHLRLAAIAGLPGLHANLRRAFDHWDRIRRWFAGISATRRESLAQREHRAMVRALARKDEDLLRVLLFRHSERPRRAYLRSLPKP